MGLRNLLLALTGGRYRRISRGGIDYRIDTRDFVQRSIIKHGAWEPRQTERLIALCEQRDVDAFLDVGAYFGYYAVLFAHRFPNLECHAFEATPVAFERLQAHVALNRLEQRVRLHPIAVSDGASDQVTLSVFDESRHGHSRIQPDPQAGVLERVRVPAAPLDEIVPDWSGRSIALKIDVEGHELAVLQGAERLLGANRVALQVECFAANQPAADAWLTGHGFAAVGAIGADRFYVSDTHSDTHSDTM